MSPSQALQAYAGFAGSADELCATVDHIADRSPTLRITRGEANERLIRHYVSVGVLDRPERAGKNVVYGFRHLLQYLVARRLLGNGFALAKIAEYTGRVPTQALLESLDRSPQRSEAELLVEAYRSPGRSGRLSPLSGTSGPSPAFGRETDVEDTPARALMASGQVAEPAAGRAPPSPEGIHSIVDLAHRVDQRIDELAAQLNRMGLAMAGVEKRLLYASKTGLASLHGLRGEDSDCAEQYHKLRAQLGELLARQAELADRWHCELDRFRDAITQELMARLSHELGRHFEQMDRKQALLDEALLALRGDLWVLQRGLGHGVDKGQDMAKGSGHED